MGMAILPPKGEGQKTVPTSVALPRWMQDRLDELVKERAYKSRSEVIVRLLEWALQELDREEAAEKGRAHETIKKR